MKKNIWQQLNKPFFVLAPMDDVTDTSFRRLLAKYAPPDLFYTEFTNVEGLFSSGRDHVLRRFRFTETERPLIAQIWGLDPEHYEKASALIVELGFDGVDINMGCPESGVVKKGCCSALINNPELAKKIIEATKKGTQGKIPVSVKCRIGFNKIATEEWCGFLLDQGIDALIVHGRTTKEMSKVPAHWDEIGKVVEIRNEKKLDTVIVGNGDVESYQQGVMLAEKYGLDGIMVGRGIFHNFWVFKKNQKEHSPAERMEILLDHTKTFIDDWGDTKNFAILRKFYKIYASGFEGASDLRVKLMETKNDLDVNNVVSEFLKKHV
jgi:nifR3 family TIM-barrel protein